MDNIILAFILILFMEVTPPYLTYRLGRRLERRDLTAALIQSISETYFEGRADAEKDCRAGLIK